ncbi:hypothetical protein [Rickettsia hoogstraalii]|uniref:hypothetical protein n=1 Tax=Rickettsia hoogstraalii TaxID=467174 RepID=UPI000A8276E0|nr:hypothetical protein [Rickettsia hoogstraalii]
MSKLLDWGKNFEDNVDILTNEIEKLLNPSLKDVLPKSVFLSLTSDNKEEKINENDKKLLENNLKFFTASSLFQVPEYDKLNQEIFENSIAYYKNNQDALVPNLVLLKTANDEVKFSKIKDILNNHYIKAKSTVGACLNVILDGQKYLKSLEIADLDITLDKQNLVDKLPLLTDKIKESLHSSEVENVKNITLLCKEVKDFLNISPIASVFEEYDNNYQALESEVSNTEKVLGEIGIEWSFS